jgi:H+/Cl- antiporter ClcA
VFFFFSLSRYYRSADGFTYFISDLHFNDGRRKFAYSIWHGLATFALLVGGAIIGIEAFAIEFISAFGAVFAQWLRLPTAQVKTLTACGITAVVAALLGQPTTALLFTIELLYGWNGLTGAIGPLAISSFVAASVGKSLTTPTGLFRSLPGTDGGLSLLKRGDYFQLDFSGSILGILILSVLAAVAAAFLIWLCKKTDKEFHQLFNTRRSMDFSRKRCRFNGDCTGNPWVFRR